MRLGIVIGLVKGLAAGREQELETVLEEEGRLGRLFDRKETVDTTRKGGDGNEEREEGAEVGRKMGF